MKRIIAELLTLMMALSLTACSGDDNAQVAGTWKWNCDMTEMFQEGVNQGAGMDLATDATMEMVFVLKLNEDGTYTLNVDRDALKTSLQTYIDALTPAAVEMIYQQLEDQGMNRADIDEAMAAEGVTVEVTYSAYRGDSYRFYIEFDGVNRDNTVSTSPKGFSDNII